MPSRSLRVVIASALAVSLSVVPQTARANADSPADRADESSAALVGDFGVGDGIEGGIDELTGDFGFGVTVGGVALAWDSAQLGHDRHGLGDGWSWHLGHVDTVGGIRVFPAGGGAYEADTSSPSGLHGYPRADLRFERLSGVRVPARADDAVGEREGAFALHELGGAVTYFDVQGDPIVQVSSTGQRHDWLWSADSPHRLVGVVSPEGVRTELDWRDDGELIQVRPAVNATGSGDLGARTWRLVLRDGRVADVLDPLGGRIGVTSDAAGLVTSVDTPSGATTELSWRARDDGAAHVDEVGVVDASGDLSRRRFTPAGLAPTGWPRYPRILTAFDEAPTGAGALMRTTELSDGRTRVRSTANPLGLLVARRIVVSAPGGDRTVHEQRFTYPGSGADGAPTVGTTAPPLAWSSPTAVTVIQHGADGATREARQTTTFDGFGRAIDVLAADGTRSTTTYDPEPARPGAPGALPVGLPVVQRTTAPDGWTTETRHELNAARTAAVVTEQYAAAPGAALERVARTEYTVADDGFVSEQRVFPRGDPAQEPAVTAWREQRDLAAGTATRTTLTAAHTPLETTTSSVTSLVHGGVLATRDAIGRTTSAGYDALGRLVRSTDEAGRTTQTRYETAARDGRNAVTVTAPGGVAATSVHDALGRLSRVTDNVHAGAVVPAAVRVLESRRYPDPATVEVTDAWGATTTMRQDVYGRTIETVGPDGLHRVAEHDDVAMTVTSGVTPTGSLADAAVTSTEERDLSGRVVHTMSNRADAVPAPATRLAYDGLGRAVATDDGVTGSTTEYDRFGNLTRSVVGAVDGSAGVVAEARFDGFGTSLEKTLTPRPAAGVDGATADAGEAHSGGTRGVDALGRATSLLDQLGRATTVSYTADGLPETVTGPDGETTTYRYDPRTRQVVESLATAPWGERVATASTYDEATGRLTAIFDPADAAGTRITYEHDADGNLTRTTYPDGRTLGHHYDEFGRKRATTDIDGHVTEYDYDHAGRLVSARQFERGDHDRPLAETRYAYDRFGLLASIERGNAVTTRFEHDSAGLVTAEHTSRGDAPVSDRVYTYDLHGNVTLRTDTRHGERGAVSTTTAYRYDALDRLIGSTVHDGDSAEAPIDRRTEYEVTAAADVAAETVTRHPGTPDESITTRRFTYDALGQLIGLTVDRDGTVEARRQEYDAGHLVRRHDGAQYAYDAAHRVVRETAADGTRIATAYWADGTRRQRAVPAADPAAGTSPARTTTYYWDGGSLVNETHAGAEADDRRGTASYLLGALREARSSLDDGGDRETRYAVTDRHGSVTELVDRSGSPTLRLDYDDYGSQLGADGSPLPASPAAAVGDVRHHPFRFAGELTDGDGTQYLRARIYDPVTTRFLTKDRAGRQNLYHFADANPVVKVDPSGREPQADFGLAMAGLALGVGMALTTPFTGGSTLALFGVVATASFDVGVAAATVVDQYAVPIFPDDWAFGLAVTAAVVGFVGIVVSLATVLGRWLGSRAAGRIGTNLYEGVPILHDGPPPAARTSAAAPPPPPPPPPRSTLFDAPPPLSLENLNRPQSAFPLPLSRRPSTEQLRVPTAQIVGAAEQQVDAVPPSVVPVAPRIRSTSAAPTLGRSREPLGQRTSAAPTASGGSTSSVARSAVIDDPAYETLPSSSGAPAIQHPLRPDDDMLPQPVLDPAPRVVEERGFFSGLFDWAASAFTPSPRITAPGTSVSPTSRVLYDKFNLY